MAFRERLHNEVNQRTGCRARKSLVVAFLTLSQRHGSDNITFSVLSHTKEKGAGRECRLQATGLSRQRLGDDE